MWHNAIIVYWKGERTSDNPHNKFHTFCRLFAMTAFLFATGENLCSASNPIWSVVHSSQELVDPCSVLHCWREVQRHFPSLHRTFWTGTFPTANISDRVPFDRWGIYIDHTESIQAVCPLTNPEIQIHTPYLGCVQSEQWIFINFQNIHHAYIALLISMIHLTNIFLFFFKNLPSCFMIWSCQPTRPIHQWNLKYLKSQVQLPLPETSEVVKCPI